MPAPEPEYKVGDWVILEFRLDTDSKWAGMSVVGPIVRQDGDYRFWVRQTCLGYMRDSYVDWYFPDDNTWKSIQVLPMPPGGDSHEQI